MKKYFLCILSYLAPFAASAETYDNPLGATVDIPGIIEKILSIMVRVGVPIATCCIIYVGFLFVTAQGQEAKVTKARSALLWTLIGFAVLLGAWTLSVALQGVLHDIGG